MLGRLETSDDFKVSENPKKDENNLESQPNKNIEISKNEDNMSSTKL